MLKPCHNLTYVSLTLWVIHIFSSGLKHFILFHNLLMIFLSMPCLAHNIPQTLQYFLFHFYSLHDLQDVTKIHTLPNLLDHLMNVLALILYMMIITLSSFLLVPS